MNEHIQQARDLLGSEAVKAMAEAEAEAVAADAVRYLDEKYGDPVLTRIFIRSLIGSYLRQLEILDDQPKDS